jgi:NAD(P)-dependent dehydrogenase (short-subunit alcohol dehydrogenase family)
MSSQLNITLGDQVAIVTGGAQGLGRAHALELAKRGALVVVNDLAMPDETCQLIRDAGGVSIGNTDDITTQEGAEALVQAAIEAFGGIHIVVNNAGIIRDGAFHSMDDIGPKLEAIINVHMLGTHWVSYAAFKHMRDEGYGRIINTTSASGLFGNFGQTNYGMAKAGIAGLTKALAQEGVKKGIMANAIAPVAKTGMTAHLGLGDDLDPAFVSQVVAYLASNACALNGSILSCGGGHVAEIFLGVTPGITDLGLTAETIADNLSAIRLREGYMVPSSMMDEVNLTAKALEDAHTGMDFGTLAAPSGDGMPETPHTQPASVG